MFQDTPSPRTTYSDVGGHFDKMAKGYDAGCSKVGWIGPELIFEKLSARIDADLRGRALRVLDFGAGTGRLGELFKQVRGDHHITGVDISTSMLQVGKAAGRIDETLVGDAAQLAHLPPHAFDIVTSAGVFDFIEDPATLAQQAARILKPGGHLALTFEAAGTVYPGHKTLQHDPYALSTLFTRHGFNVRELERVENIYTHFRTGQPVENYILIGTLDA